MKPLIFTLIFLLLLPSCKKEEQAIKSTSVKVESTKPNPEVEKKDPAHKPTMDIFAAIDAENVDEIKKNIEFDKSCLEKKDPEKKFHFPLHYAAFNGKLESVKALANYVDVNKRSRTHGSVSLIYAARKGHLDIVKFLVEKGADVNIIFGEMKNGKKINSGFTALYASCIDDNWEITKFLLKNGADHKILCAADQQKPETAYDIAIMNSSNGSKDWLDKYNAKTAAELLKKLPSFTIF